MAERADAAACMAGSKKHKVLRPWALAWYMAKSARLSSSCTDWSWLRNSVMPMLGVLYSTASSSV